MSTFSKLMLRVVKRAAWYMPDKPPDPLRHKRDQLGRPLSRVDGPAKVRGEARFAAEFKPENLAHAALVYSSIARGKITNMETAAAEEAGGVIAVVTHENAPKMEDTPRCLVRGF